MILHSQFISDLPSPTVGMSEQWLNVGDFSDLVGVAERRGRLALANAAQGKTWRRHTLTVRTVECVGGKSGTRHEVLATSLPPELYARWIAQRAKRPLPEAPSVTLPVPVITHDPTARKRTEKALWIHSIIEPVIGLRRHTPERSAAIAKVLSQEYTRPDGEKERIGQSQLYEWLRRYETGQLEGIRPKQRKDVGQRRVLIGREWDKACPLDEGKKRM